MQYKDCIKVLLENYNQSCSYNYEFYIETRIENTILAITVITDYNKSCLFNKSTKL